MPPEPKRRSSLRAQTYDTDGGNHTTTSTHHFQRPPTGTVAIGSARSKPRNETPTERPKPKRVQVKNACGKEKRNSNEIILFF